MGLFLAEQRCVRGWLVRGGFRPAGDVSGTASHSPLQIWLEKMLRYQQEGRLRISSLTVLGPAEDVEVATFRHFVATRLQAWWRMAVTSKWYWYNIMRPRFAMYQVAALEIQQAYARHAQWHQHRVLREDLSRGGLPWRRLVQPPLSRPMRLQQARRQQWTLEDWMAYRVQRAWVGFSSRRVFLYFRNLLMRFRSRGNPQEMLRVINPREAGLVDAAMGVRVMMRLGGYDFPPRIYYKIFTEAPVCDVGAFAPRDYGAAEVKQRLPEEIHNHPTRPPRTASTLSSRGSARSTGELQQVRGELRVGKSRFGTVTAATRGSRELAQRSTNVMVDEEGRVWVPAGWYQRTENNGWRPVSVKTLAEAEMDPIQRETAKRSLPWHWSRLQRKQNRALALKQRKREWLKKLYRDGWAQARRRGSGTTGEAIPEEKELEEESLGELLDTEAGEESRSAVQAAAVAAIRSRLGLPPEAPLPFGLEPDVAAEEGRRRRDEGEELLDALDSEDFEEQASNLLEWTDTLDFDAYMKEWSQTAISGAPPMPEATFTADHFIGDENPTPTEYPPTAGTWQTPDWNLNDTDLTGWGT